MKDMKLSEVKKICKKNKNCVKCELYIEEVGCEIAIMNLGKNPEDWEIEEEQQKQEDKNNEKND